MTSKQISVTLDKDQVKALQQIADENYEGNFSMALRFFLKEHKVTDVLKK